MKATFFRMVLCLPFLAFSFETLAQDAGDATNVVTLIIPDLALLDLEGSISSVSLTPTSPTEAGSALDFTNTSHSGIYLNYSSILPASLTTRSVQAKITGTLPPGVTFKLSAASATGSGGGLLGTPAGSAISLSDTDQPIVTGITSAFTGNGNQGHQLTYSLELTNASAYSSLRGNDTGAPITVTYTLADD